MRTPTLLTPWMAIWRSNHHLQTKDVDRYKRIVATCTVDSADIGEWMVRMGWAFDFTRYSEGYYGPAQAEAIADRRGLWQGECEKPWEWRRNQKR